MQPADIEKHISVLMENRPEHHGVWDGDKLNCTSEHLDRVSEIKARGIDNLQDRDVVFLFTGSGSAVGTEQTFHYFLPDFFRLLFFKREFGYSTDVEDIFERLDDCNLQNWPKTSQMAVLDLCRAGAELEQEEHKDFFDAESEDIADLIGRIKSSLEKLST